MDAGLLEAPGETRGRFYLGTAEIREIYAEIRASHHDRVTDPYAEPAE